MLSYSFKQQAISSRLAGERSLKLIQRTAIAQRSDQGLTLIESLIAIVIIAITMVSISPPIFWAVASRVQTQRAEQALKLAQGEIDRVRTIVERGDSNDLSNLPPAVADAATNIRTSVSAPRNAPTGVAPSALISIRGGCPALANPGTGNLTTSGTPTAIGTFAEIDTDGNCRTDYLLQTFRSQGLDQNGAPFTNATGQTLSGFVMGVRVYAAVAKPELTAGRGGTQPAALRGTNGLGNQLNRPLAVLYSTIVRSNDSQNLELYRKLCPTDGTTTGSC